MEGSFEDRKRELIEECKVPSGTFAAARERLRTFLTPFLLCFCRVEQKANAEMVVSGLISDLEAKNAESISYLFELDRKRIQQFIGESPWQDRPLRDELVRQVAVELGESDGIIVFDPSSFPKSGKLSVGVARQWSGRLGKVDNCQVAVYMAYVTGRGHALVDSSLYLPKEWTQNKTRMKSAGVPKDRQKYRTRHELILEQLDRYGCQLPHQWITGDDELGRPAEFRRELRSRNEQYLLAVPSNTLVRDMEASPPEYCGIGVRPKQPFTHVSKWALEQSSDAWHRIDVRDGEKGPLIVEAIKRRIQTGRGKNTADETLVVIRYRDRESAVVKIDYYLGCAFAETSLAEFCRVAKAEHRIEECIQRAKGEAGMADYEVRNWVGWNHHQTLSLLAIWFLLGETRRAKKKDTCNHRQPSATGNSFHLARSTRMRFAPRRNVANADQIGTQSNG
ncbi:MAG TPA: IS701 family transposase [Pirellulaceae bacterium]|nr:IS701 family transposase [Pirellulaceae bacterium]